MCTALKETGFIRVRVPKAQGQIAEATFKEAAQFFEQPSEEKLKTTFYASVDSFRMVGYDKVGRLIVVSQFVKEVLPPAKSARILSSPARSSYDVLVRYGGHYGSWA